MKNALKKMAGLGAAVLALVVAAGVCQAAVYVNLTLAVDTVAKTWEVYATLTDPSSETLGLHGIGIDVWGSEIEYGPWTGGLAVNDGTDPLGEMALPSGMSPTFTTTPKAAFGIGFMANAASGTVVGTGIELMGVMQPSVHQERVKDTVTYNSILKGVGESAGSAPIAGGTIAWDHPVLVAEGLYTGDVGYLNVSLRKGTGIYEGKATSVTVLPATLPTPSASGAGFAAFYPMAGDNYRASFNIPEPATMALLALGGLGLVLGRKRR